MRPRSEILRLIEAKKAAIARHDVDRADQWNVDGCRMDAILYRCLAFHEQCKIGERAREELRELERELRDAEAA